MAALAGRLKGRPEAAILVLGLLHRGLSLPFVFAALHGLTFKPHFRLVQLLPRPVVADHFWLALLYLQQEPPLPTLLHKLAVMLSADDEGMNRLLIALSALIDIGGAALLCGLVRRLTGSAWLGLGVAAWFLLSTDLFIMESAYRGQDYYECLAMLCVTAACLLFARIETGAAPRRRMALWLGLVLGCAALARASLCYYPLLVCLCAGWRWRRPPLRRLLPALVLPVLLLQGGWVLKNALVYGRLSLETSSWSGINAASAVWWSGQDRTFCRALQAGRLGQFPAEFLRENTSCVFPFFTAAAGDSNAADRARDATIAAALGGTHILWNQVTVAHEAALWHRAVGRFDLAYPGLMLRRSAIIYRQFWQRIADYEALRPLSPLYVVPVDRPLFSLASRGFAEQQRVRVTDTAWRKARFPTLSLAPLDALCILCLNMLLPVLLLAGLGRRGGLLPRGSFILVATAAYGFVVFVQGEGGENMRFRLAVEPALIALSLCCLLAAWQALTQSGRQPASAPARVFWFFFSRKNKTPLRT